MQPGQSWEDFDTCGDGDDHRCGSEVRTSIHIYAYREYMMGSYYEAQQGDCSYGIDHAEGSEPIPLTGVLNDDLWDHSEAR